jgi:hypothetical protein
VYGKTAVLHKPRARDGARLESGGNGWFTIFSGVGQANDLSMS